MNRHIGHTATHRGRRCVVVTKAGERIEGRFVERTLNMRIILATATGRREVHVGDVYQFLAGNGTRDTCGRV